MAILGRYVVVPALLTLLGSAALGLENPNQPSPPEDEWVGQWADGRTLTNDDLQQVLALHQEWSYSSSEPKDGKQADLSGCTISKADLAGVNLTGANLSGANLAGAQLSGASLSHADLTESDLSGANLSRANLSGAKLTKSDLTRANLTAALLIEVDLSGANLFRSILSEAVLDGANLSHQDLRGTILFETSFSGANLYGATLPGAELAGSDFSEAILRKADLTGAKLSGAYLFHADLTEALLIDADLSEADLSGAKLLKCDLTRANLSGANLFDVDLSGAKYDVKPNCLPKVASLQKARNLDEIRFEESEAPLVELRSALAQAGLRDVEREVNCAIQRGRQERSWRDENDLEANLDSVFNLVLFDYTCAYGMMPGRPLKLIFVGILLCSIPYCFVILRKNQTSPSAIWLVVAHAGTKPNHRRTRRFRPLTISGTPINKRGRFFLFVRAILVSLYFSCLMAFRVGFREINVGNWIARMQCRDYSFSPTGRVRFLSGVQSVFSVYMLALWILTYFGRPFV